MPKLMSLLMRVNLLIWCECRNKFGTKSEHTRLSDLQIHAPSSLSSVLHMGLHGQEQYH